MLTILIVLLALACIGALPVMPYARNWGAGYAPSGLLFAILIVLLLLLLTDGLHAQEVSTMPTVAEICAAASDPNGWVTLLDGTAKGAWTLVGFAVLTSMRWLVPAALHWFRQWFLEGVYRRLAGGIIAGAVTGEVTNVATAVEEKVAEAKTRAGETLEKVGATDETIRARVNDTLGTLLAQAPPEVVSAVAAAGTSLITGQPKPAANR